MNWLRVVVIGLTVLAAFHRPARAEAFQWVASFFNSDIPGLYPSGSNVLYRAPSGFPVFGPLDLAQGGTYNLSSNTLDPLIPIVLTGDPPGLNPSTDYLDQHHVIDSYFSFTLGRKPPPGDPDLFQAPTVGVLVHVTGDIHPTSWSHLSGSLQGRATSVSPHWLPSTDVPPELLDLVQHPERIRVSGIVTGGPMNLLDVSLTIAPQTPGSPVPEPSALATLAAALGWAALRRTRTRRAASSPLGVACPGLVSRERVLL